ncbi:MAG: NUDIX hydrolase [Rhodospirillaceae bacterium]|nr:NUDIX hydrolase [Rhodospirillaceae bacterium]MBT6116469.1 NUDIX hydrolase [Rhodospirillaceae bacterium]
MGARSAVFFKSRSVRQVAALPFIDIGSRIEVLLVTSRRSGNWIVPKGWPSGALSMPQAAAREAEEEAGVLGEIHPEPLGTYRYTKRMAGGYQIACEVYVYPLAVTLHRTDWQEKADRTMRWVDLPDAPGLVVEKGLMRLLDGLAETQGAALRVLCDKAGERAL